MITRPRRKLPQPEVRELFGLEAAIQWAIALVKQYEDRKVAPSVRSKPRSK